MRQGRSKIRVLSATAVLTLLAALAGCGGGGGMTDPAPPPPPTLSALNGVQAAISGGATFPARNGLAATTDTIEVSARTSPQGTEATAPDHTVTLMFSSDNFANQNSVAMSFVQNAAGPSSNQALWQVSIGPFADGTEVEYFVRATSSGTTLTANNGGSNFEFNVPPVGPLAGTSPFAILQWFATPWRDIQRRLPEVVNAGYEVLYLPPPQKAVGGTFSVGFDPYDRFDLGDRLQRGTVRTRYGTTEELLNMIDAAHQLGLKVCFDLVANHNANRASGVGAGNYPNMIPEDFHFQGALGEDITDFSPFSFENLNWDLLGLIDIAHEDGNMVTPPSDPPNPNIGLNGAQKPFWPRHPTYPQYYPGGVPVPEDVREFLGRWGRWLGEVAGADCFRLDAVKHTPPPFFGGSDSFVGAASENYAVTAPDFAAALDTGVFNRAGRLALTFGEAFSGDPAELSAYAKTGMALLDFTLTFNSGNVFNAGGAGNMGVVLGNPPSGDEGIGFQLGGMHPSIAIGQIHNHDVDLPESENLAYALLLTRPGQPVAYFDGNNLFTGNEFPKSGRTNALGEGDDATVRLVEAHREYARGNAVVRMSNSDVLVFERQVNGQGLLLVGLNDNTAGSNPATVTVDTAFTAGDVLVDLSGQMGPVTVEADSTVTVSVPSNFDAADTNNGAGYVLYGLQNPDGFVFVRNGGLSFVSDILTADGSVDDPEPGTSVLVQVAIQDLISLELVSDSSAASAVVRLDGQPWPLAGGTPIVGSEEGLSDEFVEMTGGG